MGQHKAPGKSDRKGITLIELTRMFPDDAAAERWFIEQRWPDVRCIARRAGSVNIQERTTRKPQPLSVPRLPQGLLDQDGHADAGVEPGLSDLGDGDLPVQHQPQGRVLDEAASGPGHHAEIGLASGAPHPGDMAGTTAVHPSPGRSKWTRPISAARWATCTERQRREARYKSDYGKAIVAGAKDRATNAVRAQAIEAADKETLSAFIDAHAAPGATIYTDEGSIYRSVPNRESVSHKAGEYVRDDGVSTNGIESFWSMLKRAHKAHSTRSAPSTWIAMSASSPAGTMTASPIPPT